MQPTHPDDDAFPSIVSRRISPLLNGPGFTFTLAGIIIITYILDLGTPLGVPVWLLYFVPLVLSFWSRPYYAVPTVCVVTLLFLAAGFVFSPPGIQTDTALAIRIGFSLVFIGISAGLWMIRRKRGRTIIFTPSGKMRNFE